MRCDLADKCGGCVYRNLAEEDYRKLKIANFQKILAPLGNINLGQPIFIADSTRRRASLAFRYHKKQLQLGFNQSRSERLVDVPICPLLTPKLNDVLANIRRLVTTVCTIPYTLQKGKKRVTQNITSGDVWLCEAANGVDVVLEYDAPLELNHRMALFEQLQSMPDIIRLSHRRQSTEAAEPIMEKSKPFIKMGGFDVYIPAGTFLQPSREGEQSLISLVQSYMGNTEGKMADLFCGVGTFSYILAQNIKNKITSIDSSSDLLKGFNESIKANQIPNIEIVTKNLFKYPLDVTELREYKSLVIDPPRAGCAAQARCLAALSNQQRLEKIIMISCNPRTFVNDAQILLTGGYRCREVTMVDQFVYSDHSELVALFTKE